MPSAFLSRSMLDHCEEIRCKNMMELLGAASMEPMDERITNDSPSHEASFTFGTPEELRVFHLEGNIKIVLFL